MSVTCVVSTVYIIHSFILLGFYLDYSIKLIILSISGQNKRENVINNLFN